MYLRMKLLLSLLYVKMVKLLIRLLVCRGDRECFELLSHRKTSFVDEYTSVLNLLAGGGTRLPMAMTVRLVYVRRTSGTIEVVYDDH